METAAAKVTEMSTLGEPGTEPKRGRRPRQQTGEVVRYFLAKEGSSQAKPELGEEAQSESEALIKAFQSKGGVIYVITAYRAEAEVQGGNPILVKRPLGK